MGNQAISRLEMNLSDVAPKSIDEIGDRTFRVKERLWAWNTLGNLKYIWCEGVLNRTGKHVDNPYPAHFLDDIARLEARLEQLETQNKENKHEMNPEQTVKDIESIKKQIEDFKSKQCPECVEKIKFRIDKFHDQSKDECICLASGPSVLDKDGNILPKVLGALKRTNIPIIVADRSLIPCLKEGIIPKYVVAADGADHVAQYFQHELVEKAIKERGLVAIFNVQIHPNVTKIWVDYGGKILWYSVALDAIQKSKSLSRYLMHMCNDVVISVPWGHVGGYQFGFGFLMGHNPIILMGMDLGFAETDLIEDTPYWNPYFKATVKEYILKEIGLPIRRVPAGIPCFECNHPKQGEQAITDFNANNPKHREMFEVVAKRIGYDDQHEYTSKDKEFYERHKDLYNKTIKEHFHFYTNPFGNKVYHDNIFKAYKDIMLGFFINNPMAKVIQCSEHCTMFATPCDVCKGTKKVNKNVLNEHECPKCHITQGIPSKGELVQCPTCLKDTGKKNEKGEPIFESCGIKASNIQCVEINDFINKKLEQPLVL